MQSIYINGDSYSAPCYHKVYGDFLQHSTGRTVDNQASIGVGNRNIIRNTLQDLNNKEPTLCILGLSFITREELWVNDKNQWNDTKINIKTRIREKERKQGSRFVTDSWMENNLPPGYRRYLDICRQWCDAYVDLYMLAHTLTQLGHDYYIFGAAHNSMGGTELDVDYQGYLFNLPQYIWCKQNPRILALEEFDIPSWAQNEKIKTTETGHLLEEGHKQFADWLKERLEEQKLL
jgi:hypothetical protein